MILWVGDYIRIGQLRSNRFLQTIMTATIAVALPRIPGELAQPATINSPVRSVLSPDRRSNKDSSNQSQSDFRRENAVRSISGQRSSPAPAANRCCVIVATAAIPIETWIPSSLDKHQEGVSMDNDNLTLYTKIRCLFSASADR